MSKLNHILTYILKLSLLLVLIGLHSLSSLAQNIDYSSRIIEFYGSDCGDDPGVNSVEEHIWHGWISDDVDVVEKYSGCVQRNHDSPYTFRRTYAQRIRDNVTSSSISFRISAWEHDGGSRCSFDSSVDDCRINKTCTYLFIDPLEDSTQLDTPSCGSTDYTFKAYYSYKYSTTTIAQATEYVTTFFSTGGDKPFWGAKGSWGLTGDDCAASGTISHNDTSSFSTTAFCRRQIKFQWRVSSESGKDYLKVFINDTLRDSISGTTSWAQKTLDLNYGNNKVEWIYTKNDSISDGDDRGFVDQIIFIDADSIIPGKISGNQTICEGNLVSTLTNVIEAFTFFDRTDYQWQSSTDLISWNEISNSDSINYTPTAITTSTYFRRKVEDGCGSLDYSDTLLVVVNNSTTGTDVVVACDSYVWIDGITYTSSNNSATFNLINSIGCDSIISLNLIIGTQSSETIIKDTCENYFWRGVLYSATGIFIDTISNFAGCDSIITLDLTIRNQSSEIFTLDVCDSLVWSGKTYKLSGIYFDTISNVAGCDSILTLNLTVRNRSSSNFNADVCNSYDWQGNTYSSTGIFSDTLVNSEGCDSVLTLDLIIRNNSNESFSFNVCDSLVWQGTSYVVSGTYFDTIPNVAGCDSIMKLNLIVRNQTSETFAFDICDSLVWQGSTFKTTGTYFDTISNVAGCDSLMTLNLIVRTSNSSSLIVSSCDSYFWPQTSIEYTNTGTYFDTILNVLGCDSIISLNLDILHTSGTSRIITDCNSYTWGQTNITYTSSGTYDDTLVNAAGCDSIISLNLTIDSLDIGVTNTGDSLYSNQPNALSYQWLVCSGGGFSLISGAFYRGYKPTQNGTYAVEVTNGICYDISLCEFVSTTSVTKNNIQDALTIYPNPANNKLSIKLDKFVANSTLQILKLDGSLAREIQIQNELTEIDVSDLANGIYFIRYNSLYKKIVISR